MAGRSHLIGALVFLALAVAGAVAAALARLARDHRVRQCAGRARPGRCSGAPAWSRSARRSIYCIGAYAVALLARWTGFIDAIGLVLARRHRRRRGRLAGRLPARALSRNLLRHAQPRVVDDPLRRAGEDRVARLDRRIQRQAGTFLGFAPHGEALGRALYLADARLGALAALLVGAVFPHRSPARSRRRSATTRSASSFSASRSTG